MKQYKNSILIILTILMCPISALKSQENGQFILQNFLPKEYKGETQNWSIVQDHRGIMYFGNSAGVLEFDGNNWRTITPKYSKLVRSLAIDSDGVIYVGSFGDFGVLTPDATGLLQYISLLNKEQRDKLNFKDVWKILATNDGVYFVTPSKLIKWKNGEIKVIKAINRFHRFYYVNNTIYGRDAGQGIFYIENDVVKFIEEGKEFVNERIYTMLPYGEDKILIGTLSKGCYLFTPKKNNAPAHFEKFRTEADDFLLKSNLYQGLKIDKNYYLLGTRNGGIIIIDENGKKINILNKENQLIDDNIHAFYRDTQGGIWVAYNNGLSRIEFSLPLKTWGSKEGLKGTVHSAIKNNKMLYIGASTGLYSLSDDNKVKSISLKTNKSQTWDVLKIITKSGRKSLFISQNSGVYELYNNKQIKITSSSEVCYSLKQSSINPNRIYAGFSNRLSVLECINEQWKELGVIKKTEKHTIRYIEETKNGNLWIGTNDKGLLFIEIDENDILNSNVKAYGKTHGLKSINSISLISYKSNRFFSSDSGVYLFNSKTQNFILDKRFNTILKPKQRLNRMLVDGNKIWAERTYGNSVAEVGYFYENKKGSFTWKNTALLRYRQSITYAFYIDENEILWAGGSEGLVSYDTKNKFIINTPFKTLIREVAVPHLGTVFSGSYLGDEKIVGENKEINLPILQQPNNKKLTFKYKNNTITFKYSAPSFDDVKANLFSHKLTGFDDEWSEWSSDSKKEYTNLPEREYIFRVKAKNIYNVISSEGTYSFTISPPWYRTPLAFLTFTISFLLFIWGMIALNSKRLTTDNKILEEKVSNRTAEIGKQNTLLQKQKDEISSKKDELEKNYDKLEDALDELRLKNKEIFFQKQLVQDQTDKLEEAQKLIKAQNKQLQKTNSSLEKEATQRAKELEITYQNLLETKTELDLYIYRSAHDLKAPITRLLGLANVAKMELKNSEPTVLEYLDKFKNIGYEMWLMQRNLVLVHTTATKKIETQTIDWEILVFGRLNKLSKRFDFSEIAIATEINTPHLVISDIFLLKTLFEKLMLNAIRFRRKEATDNHIKITISQTKNATSLSIKDNGVGIDKEMIPQIFDMFSVCNVQSTGAGLGLFIAKGVSKRLGGTIYLNTLNTAETEFIFTLPHKK